MGLSILGISAYRRDSAAVVVSDGEILATAQEERFTRRKFEPAFPAHAIRYCLAEAGLPLQQVDHLAYAQRSAGTESRLRADLERLAGGNRLPPLLCVPHHLAQAAAAFLASPSRTAAVLCVDGTAGSAGSSIFLGEERRLVPKRIIPPPHSLGLLYSAFTHYCGFKVNSGEYKLMGLAPYGKPRFVGTIRDRLVRPYVDGTFGLDLAFIDPAHADAPTTRRFHDLFGAPPRAPDEPLAERHLDLARSVQQLTEELVLQLARAAHADTGERALCLAGGVALNCVANGTLLREGPFENVWIQPAAGEAGTALGAALYVWNEVLGNPRRLESDSDLMRGAFLGPAFDDAYVETTLTAVGAVWRRLDDAELFARVAALLADGRIVGWMQGRMEFGPRALGARSILGDPRRPEMRSVMNLKIKRREPFRPFAPAVLAERARDYFEHDRPSPYMLFTAPVARQIRLRLTPEQRAVSGLTKLTVPRSTLPAVTHVDCSARLQTVHRETNPRFYRLLEEFERRTGCAVLIYLVQRSRRADRLLTRRRLSLLHADRHGLSLRRQHLAGKAGATGPPERRLSAGVRARLANRGHK